MSRVSQAKNTGKYFLLIDNMLVVLGFRRLPAHLYSLCRSVGWAAAVSGDRARPAPVYSTRSGHFGGAIADRFGAETDDCHRYADARRICHHGYRA